MTNSSTGWPNTWAYANSLSMPLVVPVDRAPGFEQRLDEFMQKEEARLKQRTAKPGRRASQRM